VIDIHLSLRLPERGRMEWPWLGGLLCGALPPAVGYEDVVDTVFVNVADAEAVVEVDDLYIAWSGDMRCFPLHERIGLRAGDCQAIGAIAKHEAPLAVAIAIEIQRAFVVGDGHNDVLLPGLLRGIAGILEPPGLFAGEIDDDQVLPAVAIDVLGPVHESVAIRL